MKIYSLRCAFSKLYFMKCLPPRWVLSKIVFPLVEQHGAAGPESVRTSGFVWLACSEATLHKKVACVEPSIPKISFSKKKKNVNGTAIRNRGVGSLERVMLVPNLRHMDNRWLTPEQILIMQVNQPASVCFVPFTKHPLRSVQSHALF